MTREHSSSGGPRSPGSLKRCLGPADAAAIIIANVIGVGIFTTPGAIASIVGHPIGVLAVWVAGGLLAFAGAMAYAELAVRFPRAGGEYVYLKESYGPTMGFLTGWTSFVAGFSGAIAAASVGCATILGRFFPAAADAQPIFEIPIGGAAVGLSARALVAIAIIVTVSGVNIVGVHAGKIVQNTLTVLKISALLLLIVAGLSSGHGSIQHFTSSGPMRIGSWATAMIPVMFSYSGWNAATYVVEEIRNPLRNVPRALAAGTLAVVLIYVGLNVVYLFAFPVGELTGARVGEAAAAQLLGTRAGAGLAVVMVVIILSSISAMVLAGPRIYFAMAQDGLFFRSAAIVHPRFRTPHVAIVAQALWASVLVLSGTFDQLLMYTGFAVLLFSAIAVASLFVTRRKHAATTAAFAAWGYPVAPAFFCVISLLIVANAARDQPQVVLTGAGLILTGVPLYWWLSSRRAPAPDTLVPDLSAPVALADPEI